MPIDLLIANSLIIVCWLTRTKIRSWTVQLARSIEFYELSYMLIHDRIKYLLHQRVKRREQNRIERNLLFFSRPDFSHEINVLLRTRSI